MFHSRYLWKLYAGYVALILVTTFLAGVLLFAWLRDDTLDELRGSLTTNAQLVRELCGTDTEYWGSEELRYKLTQIQEENGIRTTLVDTQGVVLADTEQDPSLMDNHAQRPEIIGSRTHGVGSSIRFSNTLNRYLMYVAIPVTDTPGEIIGYIRLAIPLTIVEHRLRGLAGMIILWVAIGAMVAMVLGFVLARRVTGRITSMNEVVHAIISGDLAKRAPVTSRDEVGELAQSINQLAGKLQERFVDLLQERAKLVAVLSGMVEGVIAVDNDDVVVHINSVAAHLLGADVSSSTGKRVWETIRAKEVSEVLAQVRSEVKEITGALVVHSGASSSTIEMLASPMRGANGEVTGAVVVLHDVTKLKRLESIRRDFVANAAHELQTPLAAIRGMVETIIDDESMTSEQRRRFLTKIGAQTVRLSSIVTDLLTLSKLESSMRELMLRPIDLQYVIRDVVKAFLPKAEAKCIDVSAEAPDVSIIIDADDEALHQVIGNLIDNAVKYTPANGSVRVRAKVDGDSVVIEVQDTGVGIEPKELERIFERFYRVDKGRSAELGGTGLGLSIVRHVTLSMGGDVSVESIPGKGSTFRVTIPTKSASK